MKKLIFLLCLIFAVSVSSVSAEIIILREGGIPDASETQAGKTELATDAETVTGTATDKVTTPANITAKMSAPGPIGDVTPDTGTFTDLLGLNPIISVAANTVLTAAQCKGQVVLVSDSYTVTLPPVVVGASVTVRGIQATPIYVDANASDRIVLNGIALDDGDKITSPSVSGCQATLIGDSAIGWTVLGMIGGWVDGG